MNFLKLHIEAMAVILMTMSRWTVLVEQHVKSHSQSFSLLFSDDVTYIFVLQN